jgi:hypothetical protein
LETLLIRKVLLVIFMICACAAGYYFGHRAGVEEGGMTAAGAEYAKHSRLLADQFRYGSCEAVRESLLEYDKRLEALFSNERFFQVDSTYFFDKTLVFTRLYQLETEVGNDVIAGNYLQKAMDFCRQYRDKDCSLESLLELMTQVDASNPITCLQQSSTPTAEKR